MKFFPALVPLFLLSLPLFFSCSREGRTGGEGGPQQAGSPRESAPEDGYPGAGGAPAVILRPGEQPLWFELGEEGPHQILFPAGASLKPFDPWPLARYVSALLAQDGRLVMGINREGFLVAAPGAGTAVEYTALRRVAGASWGNYTLGTLFLAGDIPAALLYRNDFFSVPHSTPPEPPVWALVPGETQPVPLPVPAFEGLSAEGGEVDGLRRGPDGFWYYREIRRAPSRPRIRYYRTPALDQIGAEISLGVYRNSALPEPLHRAPPVLLEVLEEVFFISQERGSPSAALNIAAVVSPDFAGVRYFAPGGKGTGEELQEFAGFYQRNYSGPEGEQVTYALAIRPDGQGVFGRSGGKGKAGTQTLRFSLPPLPEGFVYTGLGMVGTALIAPWEERQEGSTGAAGFMALRAPFFP